MRRIFLLALILFGPSLMAADYPLWGKLTPGDYAVGFTARFEYDYSRTFRAKTDLDGKPVAGNRARPIQIAIWYPAQKTSANFMKYEEYAYLLGQELEFGPLTQQIKNAGLQQFSTQRRNFSSASQAAIDQLLQTKTAAVKDAAPVAGKFPLVVYAPGASGTAVENPVSASFWPAMDISSRLYPV